MTRYANGSYQRASGTRNAFGALSADLVAEGFPEIVVNSGDREPEAQEAIFRDKFRPSSGPKDVGPYNDRKHWPGHGWWKRVKGGGTVGVPGTSNHEKRRAADLGYPYNSDTPAHRRAKQLAPRHNITCEGENFAEKWHWTYWGPLGIIDQPGTASTGSSPITQEDEMSPQQLEEFKAWSREMTRQELAGITDTIGGDSARLKLIEGAVARFPGNGAVQPRTDDLAVWLGIIMDMIRDIPGAGNVDEDALAAALAPKLLPHLPAHLTALSDEDVKRIATAAADEQAKRLAI